jgi:hypothetical protein
MTSVAEVIRPGTIFSRLDQKLTEIRTADSSVPYLTLFLAVIFGFFSWYFQLSAQLALFVVLLVPSLIRRPVFWGLLSVAATLSLIEERDLADNHKYLLCYWLWVMCIAHIPNDSELQNRIIRFNARFFLIFIFLGAAVQKFLSATYMSGVMFELELLLDSRFSAFAHLVGIDHALGDESLRRFLLLQNPYVQVIDNQVKLSSNSYVDHIAKLITFYDFYVQVAIGGFLVFCRRLTDTIAHLLLLFFIFTTYIPAPVFGFGMTLAILGFALAKERFQFISAGYLFGIVAVIAYQVPWREWVLGT